MLLTEPYFFLKACLSCHLIPFFLINQQAKKKHIKVIIKKVNYQSIKFYFYRLNLHISSPPFIFNNFFLFFFTPLFSSLLPLSYITHTNPFLSLSLSFSHSPYITNGNNLYLEW